MNINKFQGKTKEEAIEKAKRELGEHAVIMNIKEIKPKGISSIFKKSTYEVTAAMEEKESFSTPVNAIKTPNAIHESINLTADEQIRIPTPQRSDEASAALQSAIRMNIPHAKEEIARKHEEDREVHTKSSNYRKSFEKESDFEQRLENISNLLEEKFKNKEEELREDEKKEIDTEQINFVKILYKQLIANEVNEKYVNQIVEEVESFLRPGNSLDTILSTVYQKLILRFGTPRVISLTGRKPKVVFFIGPTGVGKTTTIAKIASKYKVEHHKKVAFITADTYRIAATEQLRVYANILDAPMSIVYSAEEMNASIERMLDFDLIFVDTAGFSHKSDVQREDMKKLLNGIDDSYDKEVYLVLSATTKSKDLLDITDIYHEISDYKIIFTKLDETTTYGNILNIKLYSGADLSYVTIGQNVPDDIEVLDTQKIVKNLLGGK